MIKQGDHIFCKACGAYWAEVVGHPREGEVVQASWFRAAAPNTLVDGDACRCWGCSAPFNFGIDFHNCFVVSPAGVPLESAGLCTCDIMRLMAAGCQCGGK